MRKTQVAQLVQLTHSLTVKLWKMPCTGSTFHDRHGGTRTHILRITNPALFALKGVPVSATWRQKRPGALTPGLFDSTNSMNLANRTLHRRADEIPAVFHIKCILSLKAG